MSIPRSRNIGPNTAARPSISAAPAAATKFEADPDRYLADSGEPAAAAAPEGAIYTCPMHPEIRQVGPGSLSDLRDGAGAADVRGRRWPEPGTRRHDAAVLDRPAPSPRRCSSSRWAAISSVASSRLVAQSRSWIQFALATPVVAVGGLAVLRARLGARCVTRNLNMFTLIAHGDGRRLASTASSPPWRPACSRRLPRHGRRRSPVYFEAAAVDHGAGAARPGAGIARPRAHRRGDPRAARPRAQDRPAARSRRERARTSPLELIVGRRPAAGAARREGAGRRRGAGRPSARRRIAWSRANRCR